MRLSVGNIHADVFVVIPEHNPAEIGFPFPTAKVYLSEIRPIAPTSKQGEQQSESIGKQSSGEGLVCRADIGIYGEHISLCQDRRHFDRDRPVERQPHGLEVWIVYRAFRVHLKGHGDLAQRICLKLCSKAILHDCVRKE